MLTPSEASVKVKVRLWLENWLGLGKIGTIKDLGVRDVHFGWLCNHL